MGERLNPWEKLVGPGATRPETLGSILFGGLGALVAVGLAVASSQEISTLGVVLLAALAADIVGGVWANATATTRRWYHRPEVTPWSSMRFAVLHVHPFLVAWVVPGFGWDSAAVL